MRCWELARIVAAWGRKRGEPRRGENGMTSATVVPAEDVPPEAVPSMNVEQALARGRAAGWLPRTFAMAWLALAAIFAGFAVIFRRARHNPRLATALTIVLSMVTAAWMAATVLPERTASVQAEAKPEPDQAMPAPPPQQPARPDIAIAARNDTWQPVRKAFAVYNVEAPDIEQAELVHKVATRDRTTRQDSYLWTNSQPKPGSLQRPAIHLVIERFELGLPTTRPFFPDLALRASDLGVSFERLQQADEVMTKFGAMQVADAVLDSERARMPCLVFRRADANGFVLAGWYCGSAERPADRVSFVCFIDRIDLVGAGQDQYLRRLFAQAERQRRACPSQRQPGRKVTWLDHEAPVPALKLSQRPR